GKIAATGAKAAFPAGAETIELGDATLLPGFIDAHTHLTYPYERDYRVEELNALKKNIPERTLDAVEIVRRTLMAGFTTVRDVGAGITSMWVSATRSPPVRFLDRGCWLPSMPSGPPVATATPQPGSPQTSSVARPVS